MEDRHGKLIRVDHPEYGGVYEVNPGGTLLLEPSVRPSAHDILAEAGGRRLTPEEFEAEFGHLPSDDEG